jgi:anti-sigma B factor antagonist
VAATSSFSHKILPDGRAVLSLEGEFDLNSALQFSDVVDELRSNGARRIVVDLSRVHFFDSTMIGALVREWRRATEQGGGMTLVRPQPGVFRGFQIARLDDLLGVCRTRESALERLGASA